MFSRGDTHELSWFGERCLRIEFKGDAGSALAQVHTAFAALRQAAPQGLLDLTPAYRTLLLTFDPRGLDPASAEQAVVDELRRLDRAMEAPSVRTIDVPVCYDTSLAPDLEQLAAAADLTIAQASELHASASYTVAFIGFSPGFPYLLGLPTALHAPRHATPRTRIEPGSIGIAGDQCGIYPQATPGGCKIIGRTPVRLFDVHRDPPALLMPGDRVRFVPIGADKFRELAACGGGGA